MADLTAPEIVDIDQVLEASAGTGKTWTIVQLAANLVQQKGVNLDKILVVTYTDKAVGELKDRLLKALRERLTKVTDSNEKERLEKALENYNDAAIYTIHAFCRNILSQYAFENRQTGEQDLVDDSFVNERVLRIIQRKTWEACYGDAMGSVLELNDFPSYNRAIGGSSWEAKILSAAGRMNLEAGDHLIPVSQFSLVDDKGQIKNQIEKLYDDVKALEKVIKKLGGIDTFSERLSELGIHPSTLKSFRLKAVNNLETLFNTISDNSHSEIARPAGEYFNSVISSSLYVSRGASMLQAEGIEPDLKKACNALTLIISDYQSILPSSLTVKAIKQLSADYKIENGQMSYQDMLSMVWNALESGDNGDALAGNLRKRYSIALVDEFQDTDALQWKIFKRLFLDGDQNRLLVIGDPKQSIYRFRGADVNTYIEAKEQTLEKSGLDEPKKLEFNWRSTPEMLKGLDKLFIEGNWFSDCPGITYTGIDPAPHNDRIGLLKDTTERPPICVVNLCDESGNGPARRRMAKFTVKEIKRLLNLDDYGNRGEARLKIRDDRVERFVNEDDICILVKGRKEAEPFEEYLKDAGIAYSFYKKPGIWQSEEALHVNYMLAALANPSSKLAVQYALLSSFLEPGLEDLSRDDENPVVEAAERLLGKWHETAAERQWGRLFQALREESKIIANCSLEQDAERRISNIYQIFQYLESEAAGRNLDIKGLSALAGRLCRGTDSGGSEDEALHRLETELPTVKIITMHSAKGLEFPVVFIGGGFSKGRNADYYVYHETEHAGGKKLTCICIDLEKWKGNADRHNQEEQQENKRLLYVALTRAQYKLYIPKFAKLSKPKEPKKGEPQQSPAVDKRLTAGPVSVVLFESLRAAWPDDDCNEFVQHIKIDEDPVNGPGDVSSDPDTKSSGHQKGASGEERETLALLINNRFPDRPGKLWGRKTDLSSFTALHKKSSKAETIKEESGPEVKTGLFEETTKHIPDEFDEHAVETDVTAEVEKQEYGELPRGERTGSMLHEVLEEINFAIARAAKDSLALLADNETGTLIDNKMMKFRFYKNKEDPAYAFRNETARLVFNALTTPLEIDGFRLCDLDKENKIHEMEFWYPSPVKAEVKNIADTGIRYDAEGYLNGFMDMVFRRGKKYYLLDWKSNYLKAGYGESEIASGMEESKYNLQYRIYILALRRWFSQFAPGAAVGGVYYLFLRGMSGKKGSDGIFRHMDVTDEDCLSMINPLMEK